MKTTKIFSVISLVLIFTAASTVFSNAIDNPASRAVKAAGIRHLVTVHLSPDLNLCNTYMVIVVNERGQAVAPPQIYRKGVSDYGFTENVRITPVLHNDLIDGPKEWKGSGPPPGWKGKRTAMLIPAPNAEQDCPIEISTPPDAHFGPFSDGRSYNYDLYPVRIERLPADAQRVKN